ncbi:hypothetical protein YPPY25_3242, partial [Yersinia pestis PY-25]
MAKKKK